MDLVAIPRYREYESILMLLSCGCYRTALCYCTAAVCNNHGFHWKAAVRFWVLPDASSDPALPPPRFRADAAVLWLLPGRPLGSGWLHLRRPRSSLDIGHQILGSSGC